MAAPKVSFRRAADLIPDPRNARTHGTAQLAKLRAAVEHFGFTSPVLIDGDQIVAGHGRTAVVLAIYADDGRVNLPNGQAIPAGMIPTLDVSGWDEAKRRAYVLADNQLALEAGWDDELLRTELDALAGMSFAVELTGFDADAIAALGKTGGGDAPAAPDEFPEFNEQI